MTERTNVLMGIKSHLALARSVPIFFWSFAKNCYQDLFAPNSEAIDGNVYERIPEMDLTYKNQAALKVFGAYKGEGIFVIENLPTLFDSSISLKYRELLKSSLEEVVLSLRESSAQKYLILLDTNGIPLPSLPWQDLIPSIYFSLPNSQKIQVFLKGILPKVKIDDKLVSACSGLSLEQIRFGVNLAQRSTNKILSMSTFLDYKKSQFTKLGLDLLPAPINQVEDLPGSKVIAELLGQVAAGFNFAARSFGLPIPNGWIFSIAESKSCRQIFLISKLLAQRLKFSLISFSLERVIANGEVYLNRIQQTIEACQPTVVFVNGISLKYDNLDAKTQELLDKFLIWIEKIRPQQIFLIIALEQENKSLSSRWLQSGALDRIVDVDSFSRHEIISIVKKQASRYDSRYSGDRAGPITEHEWNIIAYSCKNFSYERLTALVDAAAYDSYVEKISENLEVNSTSSGRANLTINFSHLYKQLPTNRHLWDQERGEQEQEQEENSNGHLNNGLSVMREIA